jgi:hypothetical protein
MQRFLSEGCYPCLFDFIDAAARFLMVSVPKTEKRQKKKKKDDYCENTQDE